MAPQKNNGPMRSALPFPPTSLPSAPQKAAQHSSIDSARDSTVNEFRSPSLTSYARPSSPVAARPTSEVPAGDSTVNETHDPSELEASSWDTAHSQSFVATSAHRRAFMGGHPDGGTGVIPCPTAVTSRQRTKVPKSSAKPGGSKSRGTTKRALGEGDQLDSLPVSGVQVPQTLLEGSFFRLRPRPAGTFEGDDWGATVAISCRHSHGTILFYCYVPSLLTENPTG